MSDGRMNILVVEDEAIIDQIVEAFYEGRNAHRAKELAIYWHGGEHPAKYPVSLDLTISNDAGVLGRICTLIGEQKANISDLHFIDRKPDYFRILVDVDVRDNEHLHSVMTAIEAESDVASLERHTDISRQP